MLAEVSAASALVFGVFEFIFYGCLITGLGVAGRRLSLRLGYLHGEFARTRISDENF
jgi:hypothetical protein